MAGKNNKQQQEAIDPMIVQIHNIATHDDESTFRQLRLVFERRHKLAALLMETRYGDVIPEEHFELIKFFNSQIKEALFLE